VPPNAPRISAAKRILGHVYFFYMALLFVSTMLVVFIPVWINTLMQEPRRSQLLHPIFRIWMGVFLPLVFCPVRRRGTQHFAQGENYVVVCNHNSFMDVPVTSPYIPGPNKTLAKAEMARIPLFGIIYKAGSVLVDRKSEASRRDSFARMHAALEVGLHLCLYPEGTRNRSGAPMQPFHDGAFITAIKAGRPIIPAVLSNTARILPHNLALWAWPRVIHFHFLEPVATAGLTPNDVSSLKECIRSRMEAHYLSEAMM
jgi:1-acyl-sn-glycerol-3-phosphate acyltransferase